MVRFLLWRALGLLSIFLGLDALAWLLGGGPGRSLRGGSSPDTIGLTAAAVPRLLKSLLGDAVGVLPGWLVQLALLVLLLVFVMGVVSASLRWRARARRDYVRMQIDAYRTDAADAQALSMMFAALHAGLLCRWWRRLLTGQPSLALEAHYLPGNADVGEPTCAWLSLTCAGGLQRMVEAALRVAYPNTCLRPAEAVPGVPPVLLRLKKHAGFIRRTSTATRFDSEPEPVMDRLMTAMGASGEPAFVQIAVTPAPASFETLSKHLYKRREAHLSRERRKGLIMLDRSQVEDVELRGALEIQHRPLFFADLRVVASRRQVCEQISSALRVQRAENRLVERGTAIRHGALGLYARRVARGEGNPIPDLRRGVLAANELAELWQLPSVDFATVPFSRDALPLAPAPPAIYRPPDGRGTLRDSHGAVSIHVEMRKQNTAVPGTVEQGKSSYLVASVAEDLRRERCAVIVLDPKGDAAEAALSMVEPERTCTLLDFANPTCGFNPLAVDAPADVIADYVVAALKSLFTDADIRASSDRYLRNAIIAVLAHDPSGSLWDAARLLSVGEEGYAYRRLVGAKVRALPELREISQFFTAELTAQLADSRSTTTAKLDAPVNKLARLLNSPSIKRVLLNDSLRVDFDRVIANGEVLVVKGALGGMGAGNTAVLMQLLVGMLDAALARQQDLVPAKERIAVALKIDEAPMVLNRGFAETMALKRSAGLETVACWQTDAQWVDREVREQLDALFAHRVYFATASAKDARASVALTMAEFSDTVRPHVAHLSSLGRPDVRLRLPRHHAVVSWTTPLGRQAAFIAQTNELQVDRERLALHAVAQRARGGRAMTEFDQPHWDRPPADGAGKIAAPDRAIDAAEWSSPSTSGDVEGRHALGADPLPARSDTPALSYRELAELDRAQSVRRTRRTRPAVTLEPDPLDLEILVLIAALGYVLTTQIHRRFNPQRAATTTQRRLKRLSDAGLVDRLQFHRRDGGGVPMCYSISPEGLWLLEANGRPAGALPPSRDTVATGGQATEQGRHLRQARHQIHASGWALALAASIGSAAQTRGRDGSALHPPRSPGARGRALGPLELRLPGGRVAHDFLRSNSSTERVEVEYFETIRPDATVVMPGHGAVRALDVLVELDDRVGEPGWVAKLERYDHFLSGWSAHTRRYGERGKAEARVVFVCRDRARARRCAIAADPILCACRAYAGEYPLAWDYPGRRRILFAAERDAHDGLLGAYRVARLPPAIRATETSDAPHALEATALAAEILAASGLTGT